VSTPGLFNVNREYTSFVPFLRLTPIFVKKQRFHLFCISFSTYICISSLQNLSRKAEGMARRRLDNLLQNTFCGKVPNPTAGGGQISQMKRLAFLKNSSPSDLPVGRAFLLDFP
jgi:hypothetical protein